MKYLFVRLWNKVKNTAKLIYSTAINTPFVICLLPPKSYSCKPKLIDIPTSVITHRHPRIEVHSNCIFVPKYNGIYNTDGKLIQISALKYGGRKKNCPEQINISFFKNLQSVDEAIYGGIIAKAHFGHFLTDSMSRMWPLLNKKFSHLFNSDMPILFKGVSERKFDKEHLFFPAKEIFSSLEIFERVCIEFQPLYIKKLHIPEQSFSLGSYIFQEHQKLLSSVGQRVMERRPPTCFWESSKFYISRSKLKPHTSRKCGNEPILEKEIRRLGFNIIHPQLISLSDQIKIFSDASEIVGFSGSAFFGLMLAQPDQLKIFYLAQSERGMVDYANVGQSLNIDQSIIRCVMKHPLSIEVLHQRGEKLIDVKAAINFIESLR